MTATNSEEFSTPYVLCPIQKQKSIQTWDKKRGLSVKVKDISDGLLRTFL